MRIGSHKRRILLGIFAGGVLFFGVAAAVYFWLEARPQMTTFHSDAAGISMEHNARLQKTTLSEADKADDVVLLLQQPADESELLVTARYEEGLKPIATIAGQDLQNALLDSIGKTFPGRFPGYKELDRRNLQVDGHDASEIIFTYDGPSEEKIKQRFMFVIKSDDMAVYLAAQSKASDFDRLNTEYFDHIFSSLRIR